MIFFHIAQYLHPYYYTRPSNYKFKESLQNKRISTLKKLVCFSKVITGTFKDSLYGVGHMVKDHSARGNALPPHELPFLISSKGSFISTTTPQTGQHIPQPILYHCGALVGTRNNSTSPPRGIDPMTHHTMSGRSTTDKFIRLNSEIIFLKTKYDLYPLSNCHFLTTKYDFICTVKLPQ